jgi:hypothetical protein
MALAKAGVTDITVFDHDVVESHNVPMSIYRPSDVGRKKVNALRERIEWETGIIIKTHDEKYRDQPLGRCSLISCIDQMDQDDCGRIPVWDKVKGSMKIDVMIDTRIERWFGEIYTIVPTLQADIDNYTQTLKPDSEMALQACGFHGIGSMSMAVAGDATNALFRYWNEGAHTWRNPRRYDRLDVA